MKRNWIIVIAFCAALPAFAQFKDEARLRQAVDELYQAMVDADSLKMKRMVAPGLVYVHSSGEMDDRGEFLDRVLSGRSDFVSVSLPESSIHIRGKIGIARHVLLAETNDNGRPGKVDLRIMMVWKKKGGRWILLARQAAKRL